LNIGNQFCSDLGPAHHYSADWITIPTAPALSEPQLPPRAGVVGRSPQLLVRRCHVRSTRSACGRRPCALSPRYQSIGEIVHSSFRSCRRALATPFCFSPRLCSKLQGLAAVSRLWPRSEAISSSPNSGDSLSSSPTDPPRVSGR
jgi:hypothetical protein